MISRFDKPSWSAGPGSRGSAGAAQADHHDPVQGGVAWRLPTRFRRWRTVLPEEAGIGEAPHSIGGRGRKVGDGQASTQLVDGTGHMEVAVGVNTNNDPPGVGMCDGGDGRLGSGQGRWLRRPSGRTPRRGVCGDRLLSGHGRSAGGCLDGGRSAEPTAHSQGTKPGKTRVRPRPRPPPTSSQ